MPRHQPRSSRRLGSARTALLAVAAAVVVALALPATVPPYDAPETGNGLALPAAVAGQEPTEAPSTAPAPAPVAGATNVIDPRRHYLVGPIEPPALRPALRPAPLAPSAPAIEMLEGYRWPLAHPRLTLPFGPTPWGTHVVDGERFHDGVDLATFCGDHITAAHAGTVLAAGRHFDKLIGWVGNLEPYLRRLDRGGLWSELPNVVVIDDGNGYRSMYAHFSSVVVKPGDTVKAGQLLGYEGATGHASGCHLHYGLFSPAETATFRTRPDVAKRMKLPMLEIARIDPLLLMPPKRGINAPAFPAPNLGATH